MELNDAALQEVKTDIKDVDRVRHATAHFLFPTKESLDCHQSFFLIKTAKEETPVRIVSANKPHQGKNIRPKLIIKNQRIDLHERDDNDSKVVTKQKVYIRAR